MKYLWKLHSLTQYVHKLLWISTGITGKSWHVDNLQTIHKYVVFPLKIKWMLQDKWVTYLVNMLNKFWLSTNYCQCLITTLTVKVRLFW